jgi:hypothetical protein
MRAFSQTNAADHIYSTPLERESATAKGQVVRLTFKPAPAEHVRSGSSSNTDTAHIRHPPLLYCAAPLIFKNIPCLSWPVLRILIFVHPGSRIRKQQQKRGVKKICCTTFFVATNITKSKITLFNF